ncbi:hypothetical protein [Nonomuraea aridisoli]|nr:hypothetical protein [Nonomuraea aridisoli]
MLRVISLTIAEPMNVPKKTRTATMTSFQPERLKTSTSVRPMDSAA